MATATSTTICHNPSWKESCSMVYGWQHVVREKGSYSPGQFILFHNSLEEFTRQTLWSLVVGGMTRIVSWLWEFGAMVFQVSCIWHALRLENIPKSAFKACRDIYRAQTGSCAALRKSFISSLLLPIIWKSWNLALLLENWTRIMWRQNAFCGQSWQWKNTWFSGRWAFKVRQCCIRWRGHDHGC